MRPLEQSGRSARPHRVYFAIEAWGTGVVVAGVCAWMSSFNHSNPGGDMSSSCALGAGAVVLATSLASAFLASARRVTPLEVGTVLALAHVPLGLAQAASWATEPPGYACTHVCACVAERLSQFDLDRLSTLAECAALACLVAGAVGFAARRASAARLALVPSAAGLGALAGGWALSHEGVVIGALLALSALLFLLTARDARHAHWETRVAATGARVLVSLALALAASIAVDVHLGGAMKDIWQPGRLGNVADAFVRTHRALVPAIAGCGALLAFAFRSGRPTSASRGGVLVVMVALLACIGGVTRLRQQRLDAFQSFWEHSFERHWESTFAAPEARVPEGPLPWPLRGERPRLRRLAHTHVRLRLPESECVILEVEAAAPGEAAREYEVDDGATYGDVILALAVPDGRR